MSGRTPKPEIIWTGNTIHRYVATEAEAPAPTERHVEQAREIMQHHRTRLCDIDGNPTRSIDYEALAVESTAQQIARELAAAEARGVERILYKTPPIVHAAIVVSFIVIIQLFMSVLFQ